MHQSQVRIIGSLFCVLTRWKFWLHWWSFLTLENPEAIYLYLVSKGTKIQEPSLHYIMKHRNDGLIKFLRWSDIKNLQQRSKIKDKKGGSKPSTNSEVTLMIAVSYYSTHNGCKIIQTSVAILYVNIPITTVSS